MTPESLISHLGYFDKKQSLQPDQGFYLFKNKRG